MLITHDLGLVAAHADRIAVMYAGRIVEEGGCDEIFGAPHHAYTAGLLAAMAGSDPADPATAEADLHRTDYAAALDAGALRGARIGVLSFAARFNPDVAALFDAALADMAAAGATLVEIDALDRTGLGDAETAVLLTEFKADIDAYLATTPQAVRTRTLADLIAFGRADPRETAWFGQEQFERAQAAPGLADPAYRAALARARRIARTEGVDRLLAADRLDALVAPTTGPAWTSDLVTGDHYSGGGAGTLAAVGGTPHLSVPMGAVKGLPVGLSFLGPAWGEARLLALGYAYEQRTRRRILPTFRPSIP